MILHIVVRKLEPLYNSSSAFSDDLTVPNYNISIHRFQASTFMSQNPINLLQHVFHSVYSYKAYRIYQDLALLTFEEIIKGLFLSIVESFARKTFLMKLIH